MTIWIEVLAEDIAAGEPHEGYGCPIALALRRATGERWQVLSDCVRRPHALSGHALPECARHFVANFDRGHAVDPLGFAVDIPGKETSS